VSERIPAAAKRDAIIDAALDTGWSLWHSGDMDRGSVLQTLRQHEPELRAAGILHLRLFGSVARGESSAHSDVDLMADFDRSMRLTLFDMARLEGQLSDLLGGNVDLSPAGSMKERVRARALREAIHAF
jgi:predicted nucleotidyltransferase